MLDFNTVLESEVQFSGRFMVGAPKARCQWHATHTKARLTQWVRQRLHRHKSNLNVDRGTTVPVTKSGHSHDGHSFAEIIHWQGQNDPRAFFSPFRVTASGTSTILRLAFAFTIRLEGNLKFESIHGSAFSAPPGLKVPVLCHSRMQFNEWPLLPVCVHY